MGCEVEAQSRNSKLEPADPLGPYVLTSPTSKVRVFSEVFRDRKTKVLYFTLAFLDNYRLKLYITKGKIIKEA